MATAVSSSHKMKLFIGNLKADTTRTTLTDYFIKYGQLSHVIVVTNRSGKTYGFVQFQDPNSARKAYTDAGNHPINGNMVSVRWADSTANKNQKQQRRNRYREVEYRQNCKINLVDRKPTKSRSKAVKNPKKCISKVIKKDFCSTIQKKKKGFCFLCGVKGHHSKECQSGNKGSNSLVEDMLVTMLSGIRI